MHPRLHSICLVVVLVPFLAPPALAVKRLVKMYPPLNGESFWFEMEAEKKNRTRFTIRRDPARADKPANPKLHLVRGASLQVYGDDGLLVSCPVQPREDRQGRLVYSFVIDNDHANSSTFTLGEIEDYVQGGGYIGGGTYYEFRLIDFLDPEHRHKELLEHIEVAKAPDEIKVQRAIDAKDP